MPEQVRLFVSVSGLDKMVEDMGRVSRVSYPTTQRLEGALKAGFEDTQEKVHVISGRLKASGFTDADFDGSTWTGTINYGGPSGSPAYYAIYELHRGGTRPDGTPHDFFSGLTAYEKAFEDAIDSHFKPLE